MPSPFPGMDPYLEGHLWTSVHQELATIIAHQLNPRLRPSYVAFPERRYLRGSLEDVFIVPAPVVPDVSVRRGKRAELPHAQTQVLTAPVKMRSRLSVVVPHFRIAIRDTVER